MGQKSSIDRLPEDIRETFHELLRDARVTQLEATRRINEILEQDGSPERLSKSAVNRYAVHMEKIGAKLRQSREIAKMWIGRLGAEPQGETGKLLNEMIRSLTFETAVGMSDRSDPVEPRMLRDLAIAVEKLEKAASENVKRDNEIRQRALDEMAAAVEQAAEEEPDKRISIDLLRKIRQEVYGIV